MDAFERITVNVPSETVDAMRRSVAEGTFASADEMVDAALRDLVESQESGETEVKYLRHMIDLGDNSGPSIPAAQVYAEVEAIIASYERKR